MSYEEEPTCPCCCGVNCGTGREYATLRSRVQELEARAGTRLHAMRSAGIPDGTDLVAHVQKLTAEVALKEKTAAAYHASESRLATATALLERWHGHTPDGIGNDPFVAIDTCAFLTDQPAAPYVYRNQAGDVIDGQTEVPGPAPTRTEACDCETADEHERGQCLKPCTEAEQAVLDAMRAMTERYQRTERWPAWWPEWVAELRRAEELARRGLKP